MRFPRGAFEQKLACSHERDPRYREDDGTTANGDNQSHDNLLDLPRYAR